MTKNFIFREYQDSALDAGEYTVRLDQKLTVKNKHGEGALNESLVRTLIVQGKRFALDAQDVDFVFPGAGSSGDFTAVMPNIILNTKSLPWQRSPDGVPRSGRVGDTPNYPWLVLLVFNESDGIPIAKKLTLKELYENRASLAPWIRQQNGSDISTLDAFLEFGEKADDPVTVIDVARTTLQSLLPSPADMAVLTHARGPERVGGEPEEVQAVVVANRLPKSGERHSVHLVSAMYLFNTIAPENADQVSLVGSGSTVRLVSLHNWTFYCEDTGDFKEILKKLDNNQFRLPVPQGVSPEIANYFQAGFCALPHHLRTGKDTASLYRGPLLPGNEKALPVSLPVESADELLVYDRKSGMLDVTYAAAWNLGRQLALEDRDFALQVYKTKRRFALKSNREAEVAGNSGGILQLAIGRTNQTAGGVDVVTAEINEEISVLQFKMSNWLSQFGKLQNIPFHHIVPQEGLLPEESIRFFTLSTNWISCLQHGALSIGGDLAGNSTVVPTAIQPLWGFFLWSRVVAEFPKLRIEGFTSVKNNLEDRAGAVAPVEIRRIEEKTLFVYFSQQVQTVDIFLDPSNLFFGFREEAGVLHKDLKNTDGQENGLVSAVEPGDWRNVQDRTLRAANFATKMRNQLTAQGNAEFDLFTSADFALQMVEGAPRVLFSITV
ncbi:MAG: hypothetical protein ACKVU2_07440 [Saprospiraceae bacterium]